MMCIKATCRACEGTGYNLDFGNPTSIFCPQCKGVGVLILTAENWDIEIDAKHNMKPLRDSTIENQWEEDKQNPRKDIEKAIKFLTSEDIACRRTLEERAVINWKNRNKEK